MKLAESAGVTVAAANSRGLTAEAGETLPTATLASVDADSASTATIRDIAGIPKLIRLIAPMHPFTRSNSAPR